MVNIPKLNEYAIAFLCLMAAFIAMSIVAVVGTFLPDLLCIMDTDLKSASFIFLSYGIGKCLIQLGGIVINNSVDWAFLTPIALGATSLTLLATPLSTLLSVTILIYGVMGASTGLVEIVRFCISGAVWKTSNFGYHFMSIGTGIGTVLTPLIASLFVNDNPSHQDDSRAHANERKCDSEIIIPFSLFSLISVITGLGFAMNNYSLLGQGIVLDEPVHDKDSLNFSKGRLIDYIFHILLMMLFMTITGCMTTVLSLMATYGLRSNIHLDIQTSSAMTSIFGVCLLLSRMFCTCISDMVKPRTILWMCFTILTTASLNLLLFKDSSVMMLWVCSALHGLGSGPMLSTLVTWAKQYLTLTTRYVSVILFLTNVGNVLQSTLTGVLMDYFGPDMFVYTIASTRFFQVLVFFVLNIIICQK